MSQILSERRASVQLGPKETALFEKCRNLETQLEGFDRDEVIWQQTVQMPPDNIEADVKLCNGDTGPWMELVIFQDGSEIGGSGAEDVGFGEISATYDGEQFIVDVQAMPLAPPAWLPNDGTFCSACGAHFDTEPHDPGCPNAEAA